MCFAATMRRRASACHVLAAKKPTAELWKGSCTLNAMQGATL
jgi:hypothetical protein